MHAMLDIAHLMHSEQQHRTNSEAQRSEAKPTVRRERDARGDAIRLRVGWTGLCAQCASSVAVLCAPASLRLSAVLRCASLCFAVARLLCPCVV